MHPEDAPVRAVARRLSEHFGDAPPTVIVLGSGLGAVVDRVEVVAEASFVDLDLPDSTVIGHAGRCLRGRLGGAEVLIQSGRVHLYEGHDPAKIVRGIRAYHQWGVRQVVLTASVGGMRKDLVPGTLVVLNDHLNFQHRNPLSGPSYGGARFPDLTFAYDPALRQALLAAAAARDVSMTEGVYAAVSGPSYETPAEIRMLRMLGGDVVGMSTVPEVLAANQVGLRVAAIAVVSNLAAGLSDGALSHDEVTEAAGKASRGLAEVFEVALGQF